MILKGLIMIKVGLKANAAFLFREMKGDTLGGVEDDLNWRSILHVTKQQFRKFKLLITTFGGDLKKSLSKTKAHSFTDHVDYECYFVRATMAKKTKKQFREYLNKEHPFNKDDPGKGKNGKYKSTKRAYGDYLYSADIEMFNAIYEEWLQN